MTQRYYIVLCVLAIIIVGMNVWKYIKGRGRNTPGNVNAQIEEIMKEGQDPKMFEIGKGHKYSSAVVNFRNGISAAYCVYADSGDTHLEVYLYFDGQTYALAPVQNGYYFATNEGISAEVAAILEPFWQDINATIREFTDLENSSDSSLHH